MFFIPESENPDIATELVNKTEKQNDTYESSDNRMRLKADGASLDGSDTLLEKEKCDKCMSSQGDKDDKNVEKKTSNTAEDINDSFKDKSSKNACSCDQHSSKMKGKSGPSASVSANNKEGEKTQEHSEQTQLLNSAIVKESSEIKKGENSEVSVSTEDSNIHEVGCSGEGSDNDDDDDDFEEIGAHADLRQAYGLVSQDYQISVTIGGDDRLKETEDNKYIIQSLKDQYRLVKTKYLGVIKKWIQV